MILTKPNNWVPKIERHYPEVEKLIGKRPNVLKCCRETYNDICQDAAEYYGRETVCHINKIFGMKIVVDEMARPGVIYCMHDPAYPRA
jgi:hypothetical protein